jgi:hypothetical protein
MIRVTLTATLSDLWGAEDALAAGGEEELKEIIRDDLSAFAEEATWTIEVVEPLDDLPIVSKEQGLKSRQGHPSPKGD